MMRNTNFLKKKHMTINDGAMRPLNDQEQLILYKRLSLLLHKETKPVGRLVFRGESKANLCRKLFREEFHHDDNQLFSRLFYFGDKGRYYYKENKKRHRHQNKDCSPQFLEKIFKTISSKIISSHDKIPDFIKLERNFCYFFYDLNNVKQFIDQIGNDLKKRDYYLGFLHTLGKTELCSRFVSATRDQQVASRFSTDFIIIYALPTFQNQSRFSYPGHRLPAKKESSLERHLRDSGLPVCESIWPYNWQREITLTGCMFPQLIWAVYDKTNDYVVINPAMFDTSNEETNIFLNIDQEDFEKKLRDTNYIVGVLFENGEFSDILP